MEARAYLKNLKISPKKLRFLLPAIKKLKPVDALDYLLYTPKRTARVYYKAIKSAITNAKKVLNVDENNLEFSLLTIEEGQKLKRFKSGGRGGVKPIVKRFSHIKIILKAKESSNLKSQNSKLPVKTKKT